MTKKKRSVWLKVGCPPPLKARLTEYAKVTGLTEAEILRRALGELFERQDYRASDYVTDQFGKRCLK